MTILRYTLDSVEPPFKPQPFGITGAKWKIILKQEAGVIKETYRSYPKLYHISM